ncbi:MAG: hypothetical protein IPK99_15830 [Flavobacteriales bacterium]|nr:hypothetical protein [Flavobacteriales bacterium]
MRPLLAAPVMICGCALMLLVSPSAQAQSTSGVDVFLHFAVPVDASLEKATLSTLRAVNEHAPLHLAEDHQQAKFTATVDHDLEQLAEAMCTAGIPLVGFNVMWAAAPVFLGRPSTLDGAPKWHASAGPSADLIAEAKATWAASFPELYERLSNGSCPVIVVK